MNDTLTIAGLIIGGAVSCWYWWKFVAWGFHKKNELVEWIEGKEGKIR